mgnify:CR=1 FL=1
MLDDVLNKGEAESLRIHNMATPSTKEESRMQTLPSLTTIFVALFESLIIDFNATRNKVLYFHGKRCFQNVNSCKLWLRYYATTNFWTDPAGIVNLQKTLE